MVPTRLRPGYRPKPDLNPLLNPSIDSTGAFQPLILGLGPTQIVLLVITVVSGVLTVVPGRATRLQGAVHLVLLAAFLFLAAKP